jgi:hypothetical protein
MPRKCTCVSSGTSGLMKPCTLIIGKMGRSSSVTTADGPVAAATWVATLLALRLRAQVAGCETGSTMVAPIWERGWGGRGMFPVLFLRAKALHCLQ